MYLEVVSPEAILYSGEVDSVAVPGANGAFQMLDNHAPIVSTLVQGSVKVFGKLTIDSAFADKFSTSEDGATTLAIGSGVLEMRDNKIVVLVD